MSEESGSLEGREAAALLLAVGRSCRAAAAGAGVSDRTLRTRKGEESFRSRVREIRAEVFGQAAGSMTAAAVRAARTLAKLLKSRDERIRLGAARAVLEAVPRLAETTDLSDRLAALEERLLRGNKP